MKGILFKPEMIQVIREGRKTVTRRIIKPQPENDLEEMCNTVEPEHWQTGGHSYKWTESVDTGAKIWKPRYQSGETVYVKETWCDICRLNGDCSIVCHRQDEAWICNYAKWHSSLFLKEKDARTFLLIEDVRPERLQEITEEDAQKEGEVLQAVVVQGDNIVTAPSYVIAYSMLWDSINKPPYDWKANPWVWRIQFKVLPAPSEKE